MLNKPLTLFRKPDSSKPLHARWGDVAISVPTSGSWNQYDNPHRPGRERQKYGPGFVPDNRPYGRGLPPLNDEDDPNDDAKSSSTDGTTSSNRSSISLGSLRPKRLSVRRTSNPKHVTEGQQTDTEQTKPEFAYKPTYQNYSAEVNEKSSQSQQQQAARFRYIPTNGRYLDDISPAVSRSRTVNCGSSREVVTESADERPRGRSHSAGYDSVAQSDQNKVDARRSRSHKLPGRDKISYVAADRKRSSIIRPMTMTMVPNHEELYD